jgi:hypothetical protein
VKKLFKNVYFKPLIAADVWPSCGIIKEEEEEDKKPANAKSTQVCSEPCSRPPSYFSNTGSI